MESQRGEVALLKRIRLLEDALQKIADIYSGGAVRIGADVDVPRLARAALEKSRRHA